MKKYLMLLVMLATIAACRQADTGSVAADHTPSAMPTSAPAPHMKMANIVRSFAAEQSLTQVTASNPNAAQAKKYIALRHYLQLETPAAQMQAAFDATTLFCEKLNCQLLSAQYQRETPYSPPSASLSLRLPPQHLAVFLSSLAKSGVVMQHRRDAEDKTNQVVDTDARIKNLTDLRDRLRQMQADKSAKFSDIIDVQRELANTQSQLDSYASMRKVLAQETELVAMNIDFVAKQGISEQGFFAPVAQAIQNAGHVLMESVATVITFLMQLIPWLVIGLPLVWWFRKRWQRYKAK